MLSDPSHFLLFNRGNCPTIEELKWNCAKCGDPIWYDINANRKTMHCLNCEREIQPMAAEYKCNDLNHLLEDFGVFDDKRMLYHYLDKLRANKMTNVLILGSTGVGKSTWINGIANYLVYETLDDALEKGGVVVIEGEFMDGKNKISFAPESEMGDNGRFYDFYKTKSQFNNFS